MPDYKDPGPAAKLEIYVKPTCPYCKAARQHYDGLGIPYVEHDAQNDPAARKAMFAYTGGNPTVPAIVIDGATVIGSWMRPWMWRLTRATSFTCSFGGML